MAPWLVGAGIAYGIVLLFGWALCVAAGRADRYEYKDD